MWLFGKASRSKPDLHTRREVVGPRIDHTVLHGFAKRFVRPPNTEAAPLPNPLKLAMRYYQHDFENVQDYLHHRPPYLLVDRILSISATEVVTELKISGQEFFLTGHFPGTSIMPGAMMQELTTQSAGILIAARYNPMKEYNTSDPTFNEYALGVLVKVKQARFKGFARPGDTLTAKVVLKEHLSNVFDFSATVTSGKSMIMRNAFQLMNIQSATLRGEKSVSAKIINGPETGEPINVR